MPTGHPTQTSWPPTSYSPTNRPLPPAPRSRAQAGNARFATGHFLEAGFLFKFMVASSALPDFLTLPAYDILVACEFGASAGGGAQSKM